MNDCPRLARRAAAPLLLVFAAVASACAAPRPPQVSTRSSSTASVTFPADEETALRLDARGTQDYECRSKSGGASEWVLVAPEADLRDSSGTTVGKHYAGPTWESTVDGSKVVATVKARAAAPEPDAIPWLLLTATQTTGDGMFGGVKSVLRTDTHGGAPPAGSCVAGQTVNVPYSAVYSFSRAKP